MSIRKFRAARTPISASRHVGQFGDMFYDESLGTLRVSDGVTLGGLPVPVTLATGSTAGSIKPNASFGVAIDGTLSLKAGTTTQIGGVRSGNGIVIAPDGTVNLDSSGLSFSFGDFYAFTNTGPSDGACLSSVNVDQDVNIVSNGTGSINLVGDFHIHTVSGTVESALAARPIFEVKADGQIVSYVTQQDANLGAFEVVGSTTGNVIAPGQVGAMMHITGQVDTPNRFYQDGNNNYAAYVARRWNGNISAPTQVLANEDILRINATAATNAGLGNVALAQIRFSALENQTTTAQGSQIVFTATPIGSAATARVDVANISVANGVWATRVTTSGNVNSLGNVISSANVIVGGNIRYSSAVNNATGSGFNKSGGTVTANGRTGQITSAADSLAKNAAATFTINNNYITSIKDVVILNIASGATLNSYTISVTAIGIGFAQVTINNSGSGPLSDAITFNFAVIQVN